MVTICCGDVSPVRTKLLSCLSFSFRLFIVASTSPQWENVTWSDPKVKETVVKLWISDQQLSDWIIMAPKPKPNPNRLGPPPQLNSLKIPVVQQQFTKKVQPKLREVVSRHIKILAKWFHMEFSWKKFLLSWMVLLIASKMVLLMLTYEFFTMTSLVSLEVSFESNFIFLNKIFRNSSKTVTVMNFMNIFDIFCDKLRCSVCMVPLIKIYETSEENIWCGSIVICKFGQVLKIKSETSGLTSNQFCPRVKNIWRKYLDWSSSMQHQ